MSQSHDRTILCLLGIIALIAIATLIDQLMHGGSTGVVIAQSLILVIACVSAIAHVRAHRRSSAAD
ncbi:hypothetical protein [Actinomyces sp. MRS3W]|uniref:hypothetical protein n=1 Tax=Actinomyces sp. MRS3W TaxID=2800796 RepID=UPI0028FD488E|nr:hypothetical protein [Actinomyces sp. MRS3W]MDU0348605.1 hypothetical protein [Actinomyces sp. MRS3W]